MFIAKKLLKTALKEAKKKMLAELRKELHKKDKIDVVAKRHLGDDKHIMFLLVLIIAVMITYLLAR